ALVPVAVAYVPRDEGGRAEAALALIDTYGGQVLWYAVMAGEPGREGSGDVAASLARYIAQILLPCRCHWRCTCAVRSGVATRYDEAERPAPRECGASSLCNDRVWSHPARVAGLVAAHPRS